MKKITLFFFVPLLLAGCSGNEKTIDVYDVFDDAEKSVEVRDVLNSNEDIYSGTAIFADNDLLVAVQAKPWLDYKKGKIEEELTKQLEDRFSDYNVLVSADYKLYWEANKLINEEDQQKVTDEVKKLKDLEKEET
ncbi:Sporulation lipoprotein YhcN/YlaJ OS=Ureibacillus acetophenoni OX=614649 GN=SAMN05877842_101261 PE=4 SV=1 [Ureibacillus acetophenoni]